LFTAVSHRLVTYARDFGISLGHAPARSRGQHDAGCLTVTHAKIDKLGIEG
jgi:hypothetical protein